MRGIPEDDDAEFDLRDSIDKVRLLEVSVKQRYNKLSNPSSHLLDVRWFRTMGYNEWYRRYSPPSTHSR